MKKICYLLVLSFLACNPSSKMTAPKWIAYDESEELAQNATHESQRMQYQLIQSKVLDKNELWKIAFDQMNKFTEAEYQKLKPFILEQDIPTLQSHINSGKLTYEKLTQWYLYRIVKFENDKDLSLHSIIALNSNAVKEARIRDKNKTKSNHPIYGMPILLKDNINTKEMKTTAGAHVLKDNQPVKDAFIVQQLKAKGAIILGKVNLSEWAYYFCSGCPLGYSAVGGQTLNPYGRRVFETGGSSAGSGTTMAANYAAAAVGTETSGSILSPSSQNSIVGLKPTIGLMSRTGIVPISSTLDTPGPMTRSVVDNAILLSAMTGKDPLDSATALQPKVKPYWENLGRDKLSDFRFGVFKNMLENPVFKQTIDKLKIMGVTVIELEPEEINFDAFVTFLNADMKVDLPKYLKANASTKIAVQNVADIVQYNLQDTLIRAPYGQFFFEGIVKENISEEDFNELKTKYLRQGRNFFDKPMKKHNLDAILSINNWNAGQAAMAKYPCLTVPMGYQETGEPISLTFIAKSYEEAKLLKMGLAFEQATKHRKLPKGYE